MPRIPASIKSTGQILKGPNSILHSLLSQSRELLAIQQIVARVVDTPAQVISYKNNHLTLSTETAAYASKLRLRQRNLIAALNRGGLQVAKLQVKVAPRYGVLPKTEIHRTLSPNNADRLKQTADYIDDPALKSALQRLARHSR